MNTGLSQALQQYFEAVGRDADFPTGRIRIILQDQNIVKRIIVPKKYESLLKPDVIINIDAVKYVLVKPHYHANPEVVGYEVKVKSLF